MADPVLQAELARRYKAEPVKFAGNPMGNAAELSQQVMSLLMTPVLQDVPETPRVPEPRVSDEVMNAVLSGQSPVGSALLQPGAVNLLADILIPFQEVLSNKESRIPLTLPLELLGGAGDVAQVGAKAGAALAPKLAANPALNAMLASMTFHHGSPHKFDKFRMDKIGTGEGAQAYGHGLYFAENPKVAGNYSEMYNYSAVQPVKTEIADLTKQKNHLNLQLESPLDAAAEESVLAQIKSLDSAIAAKRVEFDEIAAQSGNLYEVDIPDEAIDKMLDWDAPLSEQPESVQKLVKKVLADNGAAPTKLNVSHNDYGKVTGVEEVPDVNFESQGHSVYESLTIALGSDQAASKALNEAGIPGIKYFDGSSRAAGEGTRNLVVFDENLPRVISRNGEKVK